MAAKPRVQGPRLTHALSIAATPAAVPGGRRYLASCSCGWEGSWHPVRQKAREQGRRHAGKQGQQGNVQSGDEDVHRPFKRRRHTKARSVASKAFLRASSLFEVGEIAKKAPFYVPSLLVSKILYPKRYGLPSCRNAIKYGRLVKIANGQFWGRLSRAHARRKNTLATRIVGGRRARIPPIVRLDEA